MITFNLDKEVDLAQLDEEIRAAAGLAQGGFLSASWDGKRGVLFVHRADIGPGLIQQLIAAHTPRAAKPQEAAARLGQVPGSLLATQPWGPIIHDLLRYLELRE